MKNIKKYNNVKIVDLSYKTFENDAEMNLAIGKLSRAIFLSSIRGYVESKRLAIASLLGLINTKDLYNFMCNKLYELPPVVSIIQIENETSDVELRRLKLREQFLGCETSKNFTVKNGRVW